MNDTHDHSHVLWFSRGRGRGHAVPDLEIVSALREVVDAQLKVEFVSYSTGADVLAEAGESVIDLGLPDRNPFLGTLVPAAQLIGTLQPALVVAHEEFAVAPAAKIFGVPTVFLVDWFVSDPDRLIMEALRYADEIVFLEREGWFEPPEYLKDKTRYVGPIVRPPEYRREDRLRARQELELPADATVVSVIPGAWATESRAPLWDQVLNAFDRLESANKRLVWNAGADFDELQSRAAGRADISVLPSCDPIERLMAASDLAITKGNRGSTLDLSYSGVRSISISFRTNPIDDHMVPQIDSNRALYADQLDAEDLATEIDQALRLPPPPIPDPPPENAARAAALRIAHHLQLAEARSA